MQHILQFFSSSLLIPNEDLIGHVDADGLVMHEFHHSAPDSDQARSWIDLRGDNFMTWGSRADDRGRRICLRRDGMHMIARWGLVHGKGGRVGLRGDTVDFMGRKRVAHRKGGRMGLRGLQGRSVHF